MSDEPASYNWTIDERVTWPPRRRPSPPFGPTGLEIMRSCLLRMCFEISPGYERRIGFAARVGTAFHRALESLSEDPPKGLSLQEVAEEARRRFLAELATQEAAKAARARERTLARDEARVNRAIESLMVEAQRVARFHFAASAQGATGQGTTSGEASDADRSAREEVATQPGAVARIEVEVSVRTADGLMHGRIDLAERVDGGTCLTDYKSALRSDLPERYERQLQLYALMWHDTRGEWPKEAQVVYPFTAATHPVTVDSETCQRVGTESRELIERMQQTSLPQKLASPGDTCKVCEFRPWCVPFWRWQSGESSWLSTLARAAQGFEGEITSIETVNGHWRLYVRWRDAKVRIIAPVERFPQLHIASTGVRIRALDMPLRGQPQFLQAAVNELSELYLLT